MRAAAAALLGLAGVLHAAPGHAQISLTALGVPYTEDFNTLASAGTSSAVPAGWSFWESGINADATYAADAGASNAGDTYSFGASGSAERALGGIQSGSLTPVFGAFFQNNTGVQIAVLTINYTGEEWRLGTSARTDQLDFQFSFDATSLTTGNWTDVNALDFSTPDIGGAIGARDGNAAPFRTALSYSIGALAIPAGATFWIRWTDVDASGADDGLAVDDFSLTPNAGPVPNGGTTWGAIKSLYR